MKHRMFFTILLVLLPQFVLPQALPTQTSTLFSGSGNCATCHQPGAPNTAALLDANGHDVSPVTLWRSTMMANAARDPFWRAKVSAEVAAHPQLQQIIEDKCTTCHAPLGRTEAIDQGAQAYSIAEMVADPLALDGVSCTLCHQIDPANLGQDESFSGHYVIKDVKLIYGPYANPNGNSMVMNTGFTPVHGPHISQSELCATCHTLFTPTVDNSGNIVGEAPEQTPYLEWKNSRFAKEGIECQSCHVPRISGPVVISNRPQTLAGRSPFGKHEFVGGNVYMLRILKKYGSQLGVTAAAIHFDSTIARTLRNLQQATARITAAFAWQSDSLVVKVAVKNLTGHKFPTAYPSRRAWLYVNLKDPGGTSIFVSGAWDSTTGKILPLDRSYEPHYDVIRQQDQVQVYEAVMKDVDGNVNYTLLRAAGFLKDNRIPPEGFTANGPYYDSTAVVGQAAQDPNFNRSGALEGTGIDTVTYKIGGLDPTTTYRLEVKLLYQSLSPRFVEALFEHNTPEIQTFRQIYEAEPNMPVTIDSLEMQIAATAVQEHPVPLPESPLLISAYPNPFNPETTIRVRTAQEGRLEVAVYDLRGRKILTLASRRFRPGIHRFVWNARNRSGRRVAAGVYLVRATLQTVGGTAHQKQYKLMLIK